jgi:hypothetical protein
MDGTAPAGITATTLITGLPCTFVGIDGRQ